MQIYYCIVAGLFGLIIGSFSNVCILSMPKKENFCTRRSHCMSCGTELKWYDLIPLVSYIVLKGKCRYCHEKISIQYPIVEALTAILYVIITILFGASAETLLCCAFTSALIILSFIDYRTREIPISINLFLCITGIAATIIDRQNWLCHIIGAALISGMLLTVFFVTKGNGIGGGDIKLTFAAGLFLGWQKILIGFIIACIFGIVIHGMCMKIKKSDHSLAFGPYLAAGFFLAMLFGEQIARIVYVM